MLNIAVLVSGGGTNLQALIDAQRDGRIYNGAITAVIASKEGAYALERAARAGIDGYVIPRVAYDSRSEYTSAILAKLKELNIDLVVLAGFMVVLGNEVIQEYENRIINVHPALIPAFCGDGFYGIKVHQRALEKGVKITGATVHFVNEETDGGPIILQKAVKVLENDTPEILQKRVMEEAEWEILPQAVSLFCQGKLKIEDNRVKIMGGEYIGRQLEI